jgi:hypothetical protein
MAVTIDSPADGASVPSVFDVTGTVDITKGVPTVSGQATSGSNVVNGTVTQAPTASNSHDTVKFDTTAYQGQGLTWTVKISADYGGGQIETASITVKTS